MLLWHALLKTAAMVKPLVSEVYNCLVDEAGQIHEGLEYIADFPVEHFYLDARIIKIYEAHLKYKKILLHT